MWDEGLLVTSSYSLLEVGDEIRIYYIGHMPITTCWPLQYSPSSLYRGMLYYPSYMGLAILPRDGFSYAQAEDNGSGEITTHPFDLEGGETLSFNGDCADPAQISITLRNASSGKAVSGSLEDSLKPGRYTPARFADSIPPGRYALAIGLEADAKLYSFKSSNIR